MFEKILQKLTEQREKNSSVSDLTLKALAKSFESLITTDELLEAFDAQEAIKSVDGNINKVSADAVTEASKKFKAKSPKKEDDDSESGKRKKGTEDDDKPSYVKAIMEKLDAQDQEIAQMRGEKVKNARQNKLKEALKDTPDAFSKTHMKAFDRMSFDDDDSFESYVEEVSTDSKEIIEQQSQSGGQTPFPKGKGSLKPKPAEGQTAELSGALAVVKKDKESNNKKTD